MGDDKQKATDSAVEVQAKKTFTGGKLDWMFALMASDLHSDAKIIGCVIANHVNAGTRIAFLSDQTIHDKTGIHMAQIQRMRKILKDARWINWMRRKNKSNVYWCVGDNLARIADEQAIRTAARKQEQIEREYKLPSEASINALDWTSASNQDATPVSSPATLETTPMSSPDTTPMSSPDTTPMSSPDSTPVSNIHVMNTPYETPSEAAPAGTVIVEGDREQDREALARFSEYLFTFKEGGANSMRGPAREWLREERDGFKEDNSAKLNAIYNLHSGRLQKKIDAAQCRESVSAAIASALPSK